MSGRGAAAERNINPAAGQRPLPLDCCGGLNNVDYSKMDLKPLDEFLKLINIRDSSFCIAVIAIIFNPVFWNVVARWEHSTRKLTRLFGSPYVACYCLAFVIILLNVYRSHRPVSPSACLRTAPSGSAHSHTSHYGSKCMTVAMKAQGRLEMMDRTVVFYTGVVLIVLGTLLVVSSFLALGFTGTFLVLPVLLVLFSLP
ncbi:phosphatidylethanolamine N-methyltransferase isoform X3 [Channa argus]|uniref:phosphatidylethanolamine N-methyltransferase isoform X3 n=1 Tax=Channa argus TaxID=215402 RepID=UPI00351FAB98